MLSYVWDAQGNPLAVYELLGGDTVVLNEFNLYGSSRLGMLTTADTLVCATCTTAVAPSVYLSPVGNKRYELSNHLGNVMTVISDKITPIDTTSDGLWDYFNPSLVSATDYYPFGMGMPGRGLNSLNYRWGFNGVEKNIDINALGDGYVFEFREYDSHVGRFLSVDPLSKEYPWNSTFAFAENRVIDGKDLEGLEYTNSTNQGGTYGPLNDKQAGETDATLSPGFKSEAETSAEVESTNRERIFKTAYEFQLTNHTRVETKTEIRQPEIPTAHLLSKQIGEGVAQGLAGEYLGWGIGIGLKGIGNIPIPLYRTFGGEARAYGNWFTPINPRLYGSYYSRYAGLPPSNSGAFTIKIQTRLSNIDFRSIGVAKPIGINTGRLVPELKLLDLNAIQVKSFRVNPTGNPSFQRPFPYR